MGTQVLPEHWSELNASRSQRSLCANDVAKLKATCAEKCGKSYVTECKDCYGLVLDRMRTRYSESQEKEWFSQRRAFLQELDDLFTDAKDNKVSLKTIEAHIESEKEAWYRWVLRRNPDFLEVSEHETPLEEMRGMLDDPDRSREELVAMMWQGVGKPDNWSQNVDTFAEKVAALKGQQEELKKLYIAEFFKRGTEGPVLDHAQPYLDEYQNSDSMMLEKVMGRIVEDNQRGKSSQQQRDVHTGRLDELRRARTAFEQKRKESKALRQKDQIRPELYDLPPCATCRRAVPTEDVFSCSLCQAIVQMGGSGKMTVYCSEDCGQTGQEDHISREHDCKAGDKCVQLTDEDVDMSDGAREAALCKACIDDKRATVYCSERCASATIAAHLQGAHGADASTSTKSAVVPISELVESTLEKANPKLKMAKVEKA